MITISNFHEYILPEIYQRGVSYYENGTVLSLTSDLHNEWHAEVEGSHIYRVAIELYNKGFVKLQCTCPHEGVICKHIVAVLLELKIRLNETDSLKNESSNNIIGTIKPTESGSNETLQLRKQITALLQSVDASELNAFICNTAIQDKSFRDRLYKRFPIKIKADELAKDYQKAIRECFDSSSSRRSSRYNRYNWEDEIDLDKISDNLNHYMGLANNFYEMGSFGDAASICINLLECVGESFEAEQHYNYYDECYPLDDNCNDAENLLLKIADNRDIAADLKYKILEKLQVIARIDVFNDYVICDPKEMIFRFRCGVLSNDELLQVLDNELKETSSEYDALKLINKQIDVLNRIGHVEKIDALLEKYNLYPEVLYLQLDRLIAQNKYDLALEYIDKASAYPQYINEQHFKEHILQYKVQILIIKERTSELIEAARELFIVRKYNKDMYTLLKNRVPSAQWPSFFKELLESCDKKLNYGFYYYNDRADLLLAEADKDGIYQMIQNPNANIDFVIKYGICLKEGLYPIVFERISNFIRKEAESTGRSHYERIARYLQSTLTYEGGAKFANHLVRDLLETYNNRPAMKSELRKFIIS